MLLEPGNTLFVRGDLPALLLAAAPIHHVLPHVALAQGRVARCEGWTILPKLTMCVVDGPGEHGLVVPSLIAPVVDGPQAATAGMAGWCADAERAGGAVVLSLPRLPANADWPALLPSPTARGGFLPSPA